MAQINEEMTGRLAAAFLDATAEVGADGTNGDLGQAVKAKFSPDEYSDLLDVALPLAVADMVDGLMQRLASALNPFADLIDLLPAEFRKELGL